MQVSSIFLILIIFIFRFSHKNIDKDRIQKFIHDNEQYVLDAKKKHGKTRIDRDINEYLRKKNGNKIHMYNNKQNNTNNNNNNMNNMNTNNINYQMMNNPVFALNLLLLQNQLMQQQNINPVNQENNENSGENNSKVENDIINNNEIKDEINNNNEESNMVNNMINFDNNNNNGESQNINQNEILQKILAVLNNPLMNNINNMNMNVSNINNNETNIINNNEINNFNENGQNQNDPRKK